MVREERGGGTKLVSMLLESLILVVVNGRCVVLGLGKRFLLPCWSECSRRSGNACWPAGLVSDHTRHTCCPHSAGAYVRTGTTGDRE